MMAMVYKRKGSRYYYMRFRDRRGKLTDRSAKTTVKRVAEERAREIAAKESAIREGRVTERELAAEHARSAPIEEHLAAHLADDKARGLHSRYRANKESMLRRYFDEQRIDVVAEIDDRSVVRHMRWLQELGRSPRTRNAFRGIVKRFVAWCVEERLLLVHPFPGKTIRPEQESLDRRRIRRSLTDLELARLLATVAGTARAGVYEIATWTGLRRSEIEQLRWGDVVLDGEDSHLRLRAVATKSKRADEVPLHPEAVKVFERLFISAGNPSATDPVVAVMPTAERLYRDLDAAGIQGFTRPSGTNRRVVERNANDEIVDFHALRTTFGSRLAQSEVPPMVAAKLMRHADVATTYRHYVEIDRRRLGKELAKVATLPVATLEVGAAETGLPIKVPMPSTHLGGARCNSVQDGDRDRRRTGRTQIPDFAGFDASVQVGADKRAKGLEPSTFSLEG